MRILREIFSWLLCMSISLSLMVFTIGIVQGKWVLVAASVIRISIYGTLLLYVARIQREENSETI